MNLDQDLSLSKKLSRKYELSGIVTVISSVHSIPIQVIIETKKKKKHFSSKSWLDIRSRSLTRWKFLCTILPFFSLSIARPKFKDIIYAVEETAISPNETKKKVKI